MKMEWYSLEVAVYWVGGYVAGLWVAGKWPLWVFVPLTALWIIFYIGKLGERYTSKREEPKGGM